MPTRIPLPSAPAPRLRNQSAVVWLRLVRVAAKVEHRLSEHLRTHGLSYGQFDVLAHVGTTPGLSQQALADALLVTKGNVCQLVDRMQAAGLLVRRQEGRTNHLFLTDRGQDLYSAVVPQHEALIADLLAPLTPADQDHLLRLLRTLDHALPS